MCRLIFLLESSGICFCISQLWRPRIVFPWNGKNVRITVFWVPWKWHDFLLVWIYPLIFILRRQLQMGICYFGIGNSAITVSTDLYQTEHWYQDVNSGFVPAFRALKSRLLKEGELTTISEIHAGARLNLNNDIQFRNHHLQLEYSVHQIDSNSATYGKKKKEIYVKKWLLIFGKVDTVINGISAPSGDSFLGLDINDDCNENLNKVH